MSLAHQSLPLRPLILSPLPIHIKNREWKSWSGTIWRWGNNWCRDKNYYYPHFSRQDHTHILTHLQSCPYTRACLSLGACKNRIGVRNVSVFLSVWREKKDRRWKEIRNASWLDNNRVFPVNIIQSRVTYISFHSLSFSLTLN